MEDVEDVEDMFLNRGGHCQSSGMVFQIPVLV